MSVKYFGLSNGNTKPSNNLQKQVWSYIELQSHRVIEDAGGFVATLRNEVEALNSKYDRCQPLKCNVYSDEDGDIGIYIRLSMGDQGPYCSFKLYLIKPQL